MYYDSFTFNSRILHIFYQVKCNLIRYLNHSGILNDTACVIICVNYKDGTNQNTFYFDISYFLEK